MRHGGWAAAVVRGASAGALATGAMTVPLAALHERERLGPTPPVRITRSLLRRLGLTPGRRANAGLAALAHLGFGTSLGALFGLLLRRPRSRVATVGAAVGYAAGVWTLSYAGWIPALGILPRPDRDRPARPAVTLLSHVVYGIALGVFTPGSAASRATS